MPNEPRDQHLGQTPEPLRQPRVVMSLKQLSETGIIRIAPEGKRPITLIFNNVDALAPRQLGDLADRIAIDVTRMASVCRSFGIDQITVGVDTSTERESFNVQISGISAIGSATGSAVATGRRPLSSGELQDFAERRAPHGARWARGTVTLTQQSISDEVQARDQTLRNAETRAEAINQALINGITEVGIPHLTQLKKGDMVGLALYSALYLRQVTGLPFDLHVPNPLDFSSPLDTFNNPIVLYVLTVFLTYFISKSLLDYEDTRLSGLTPWGPEPIRALRALGYRIPQINQRFPLVKTITPEQ